MFRCKLSREIPIGNRVTCRYEVNCVDVAFVFLTIEGPPIGMEVGEVSRGLSNEGKESRLRESCRNDGAGMAPDTAGTVARHRMIQRDTSSP